MVSRALSPVLSILQIWNIAVFLGRVDIFSACAFGQAHQKQQHQTSLTKELNVYTSFYFTTRNLTSNLIMHK